MTQPNKLIIFGEALMDYFEPQNVALGGAPFNVAWHLQAFNMQPLFISRIGEDDFGRTIAHAVKTWGMDLSGLQQDATYPTGHVDITLQQREPTYRIANYVAYDFISVSELPPVATNAIVYHGSLALRHHVSKQALDHLLRPAATSVFVDVNLRSPYWDKEQVFLSLERARWAKLNEEELKVLGFNSADLEQDMQRIQSHFQLEHLIVTRGALGTWVRTQDGKLHVQTPRQIVNVVDSVGAGDAYSAVYIKGLIEGWPIHQIMQKAQTFASQILQLQGAISHDINDYMAYR